MIRSRALRRRRWGKVALGLALVVTAPARSVRAEGTCAAAYEESQVARSEGRLRAAQRELTSCTRAECAEFIRVDCARWLGEVEAAQPTVVLQAIDSGADIVDVNVTLDEQPLVELLDGKAVAVDPGRHTLVFRRAGHAPVEMPLVFREGEKNRAVIADFSPKRATTPAAPAAPAPVTVAAERRAIWPWILLGVGAAGVGAFGGLAVWGNAERHDLERSCSPRCSEDRIDGVRSKFLLADVSLGVGIAALAGSGYLFWRHASQESGPSPGARLDSARVAVTSRGAAGFVGWSF